MRWLVSLMVLALGSVLSAAAQTKEDSVAIRAAAEDYVVGWYDGDVARMERAIHPELAKRNVATSENGRSRFSQMGAMALVQMTRRRGSSPQPADQRLLEISILDIQGGSIASAKAVSWDFIDLIHLAKSDGRWVIVNDLWAGRPR